MTGDDAVVLAVLVLILGAAAGAADILLTPSQQQVQNLADAIQFAEGYSVPGSIPNTLNNPGDLTVDITGTGIGSVNGFVQYSSYTDGRAALEQQAADMLTGPPMSSIYNPAMTIAQVAAEYTKTEVSAWASNVASFLGVSVNTPIGQIPSTPIASA